MEVEFTHSPPCSRHACTYHDEAVTEVVDARLQFALDKGYVVVESEDASGCRYLHDMNSTVAGRWCQGWGFS